MTERKLTFAVVGRGRPSALITVGAVINSFTYQSYGGKRQGLKAWRNKLSEQPPTAAKLQCLYLLLSLSQSRRTHCSMPYGQGRSWLFLQCPRLHPSHFLAFLDLRYSISDFKAKISRHQPRSVLFPGQLVGIP
jgi:hypothetical protein